MPHIPYRKWKEMFKLVPMLVVDGLLIEGHGDKRKVCMVKRIKYPYIGWWVIPGGFVNKGEQLKDAVVREFREETGLRAKVIGLFGIYDDPKRDPRGHNVGVVYLLKRSGGRMRSSDETSDVRFFPINKLPKNIGFDHRTIIKDALKILQSHQI